MAISLEGWERTGTGEAFSPEVDAFHLPFPRCCEEQILAPSNVLDPPCNGSSVPHDCTIERGADRLNQGSGPGSIGIPLFRFPHEISDCILSYLSPAALDAARNTCKLWRRQIMGNRWVLSAVLNNHTALESSEVTIADANGDTSLRNLFRSLDRLESDNRRKGVRDKGRPRFRIRNLDFTASEGNDLLAAMVIYCRRTLFSLLDVGYSRFMILQIRTPAVQPIAASSKKSTLVFFSFDSKDMPSYTGSVEYSGSQDRIDYVGIAEMRPQNAWILKIGINNNFGYYLIESRNAFSSSDPRFSLTEMTHFELTQQLDFMQKKTFTPFTSVASAHVLKGSESARAPASFPTDELSDKSDVRSEERARQTSENISQQLSPRNLANEAYQNGGPRYLAEHEGSGNAITVEASSYPENANDFVLTGGKKNLLGTTVLLRPYAGCVCKNAVIAPGVIFHEFVRAAIIWQSIDIENPRSELYVYDIPVVFNWASGDGSSSSLVRSCLLKYPTIKGKRIISLGHQVGGIHPSSPLWDLATTEAAKHNLEKEAALGGLQLPQMFRADGSDDINVCSEKCVVWGPSNGGNATSISCKVVDLSYTYCQRPKAGSTPLNKHSNCACSLHDDSFNIALPPVEDLCKARKATEKVSAQRQKSSFWPWEHSHTPIEEGPIPVITEAPSRPRQEALDRETEWFRERIKCMKATGMSNFEVAELWGRSTWTKYGQFRKPEGWQDL